MSSVARWLLAQRTSVRLAVILRLVSMGAGAVLSLFWTRALLGVLGPGTYGVFLSFQGVTRLGGLGDLGITGVLAVRAGQAMGRGDTENLKAFLPPARSLLFATAAVVCIAFLVSSPWLPIWLGFEEGPGSGSMTLLFATGAVSLPVFLIAGYFNALNVANGTVTWPILPTLLVGQLAIGVQWVIAYAGSPLWLQNLGMVGISMIGLWFSIWMLRASHPWLGQIFPLRYDRGVWQDVASASGWMFLYSIGYTIYLTTDRLLINAGFGAEMVPTYLLNGKLCELALQLIVSASALSLPKIVRWIASSAPEDRQRIVRELERLRIFQGFLGISAAIVYLLCNDTFIRLWLGKDYIAPSIWQYAFALNLAITASTDAATQTSGTCSASTLRIAGSAFGCTALLNFGLSFISMKVGSISGIAFATVVSQAACGLVLTWVTTQHLGISFKNWALRSVALPALSVGAICWVHQSTEAYFLRWTAALVAMGTAARVLGISRDLLRHEWRSFSSILKS